jgi:hypothetical protein
MDSIPTEEFSVERDGIMIVNKAQFVAVSE